LAKSSWQTLKSGVGRGSIVSLIVIGGHWEFNRSWGKKLAKPESYSWQKNAKVIGFLERG